MMHFKNMYKFFLSLALGLGLISTTQAGNWQLKVGGSLLAPASHNGTIAGAKADVSHEFNLTPSETVGELVYEGDNVICAYISSAGKAIGIDSLKLSQRVVYFKF